MLRHGVYLPVQRVHLALAAKKVDAAVIWISLQKKPEWYVEIFPKGEVPLLEENGKTLADSGIIFGKHLLDDKNLPAQT